MKKTTKRTIKTGIGAAILALLAWAQQVLNQPKISWDASTTPNVQYNVYRKDSLCATAGTFNLLTPAAPVAVLTYRDTTYVKGTTVCYVVRAVDASGIESVDSNQLEIGPPASPGNLRKG